MTKLSSNRKGGNSVQVETENENFAIFAHVLHETFNSVISRHCLAEDGDEMYQNSNARAGPLFFSLNSIVL